MITARLAPGPRDALIWDGLNEDDVSGFSEELIVALDTGQVQFGRRVLLTPGDSGSLVTVQIGWRLLQNPATGFIWVTDPAGCHRFFGNADGSRVNPRVRPVRLIQFDGSTAGAEHIARSLNGIARRGVAQVDARGRLLIQVGPWAAVQPGQWAGAAPDNEGVLLSDRVLRNEFLVQDA